MDAQDGTFKIQCSKGIIQRNLIKIEEIENEAIEKRNPAKEEMYRHK